MSEAKPQIYRILGIKSENVKRLKVVSVTPSTNVVTVGGKNDQGKSSLLDSIDYAIRGQSVVCPQPIRRGANEAQIDIDLGELLVQKRFKLNGSPTLKVTMKDGTPVKSPQAILDALCSKITFDPLAWMNMESDKQLAMLQKLVGLDLSALNKEQADIYLQRTNTNRDLAAKEARLKAMPQHADAPAEEVKVADLMGQLTAIRKHNDEILTAETLWNSDWQKLQEESAELKNLESKILAMKGELARLENLLIENLGALGKHDSELTTRKTTIAAMERKSETAITDQISAADTTNSKVRENKAHKTLSDEVAVLNKTSKDQTKSIDDIEARKEQMLKDAKFPLPGLSFDDSGVLLNGLPFEQSGTATKIRASVAIGLAMNPQLRVILIRNGSQLDDDSMKLIETMAAEMDFQAWVEINHDINKASVIIEDGSQVESIKEN